MYCESCGSFIPDGQSFCTNCGAPVTASAAKPVQAAAPVTAPVAVPAAPAAQPVYQQPAQPVYQQPVYQQPVQPVYQPPVYQTVYQQPAYQQVNPNAKRGNGAATAGLVFGILTLVFCWIPFLFGVFGLMGLIFSIVGLCKRNASGKGKAIAGLILTILGSVIGALFQTVLWAAVAENMEKSYSNAVENLYNTSYSANGAGSGDFFIDGDFVTTDNGYVSGVLHIDGFRVDF